MEFNSTDFLITLSLWYNLQSSANIKSHRTTHEYGVFILMV